MTETLAATGIGALVMRPQDDSSPVGYSALVVGRASLAEPELAYEMLPGAQGRGYATEGSRALMDAAWDTGRERLWATIRVWNTASLRVADKLYRLLIEKDRHAHATANHEWVYRLSHLQFSVCIPQDPTVINLC